MAHLKTSCLNHSASLLVGAPGASVCWPHYPIISLPALCFMGDFLQFSTSHSLSLYSMSHSYKLSALLETNPNTRQQRDPALRSGFLGHESVEGPWLEDVSGCSLLSGWGGIVCVSCRAMILHDTLMVTINALIGQLNRIKSNLPAQHARKI